LKFNTTTRQYGRAGRADKYRIYRLENMSLPDIKLDETIAAEEIRLSILLLGFIRARVGQAYQTDRNLKKRNAAKFTRLKRK